MSVLCSIGICASTWARYLGVINVQLQRTETNEIMKAQAVACMERCQYRPREVEGSVMGKTGCKHGKSSACESRPLGNVCGYALESFWEAGEWFKILTEWISYEVIEGNKLVHWSEEPVTTDKRQSEGSIDCTDEHTPTSESPGWTRYPECKSWSPGVSRQAHEWIRAGLRSPENATRWAHEHLENQTISMRRITPAAIALVTLSSSKCAKMGHKISAMRKPTDVHTDKAAPLGHVSEVQAILWVRTLRNGAQASTGLGESHRPNMSSKVYQFGLVYVSKL
ncbi:hypothetical protein EDD15DRAFT_2202527 [Pisolithus albus]|nr:hypothetical protein EDD15DRAFT_2202527 [Pisolithus albus]